MPSLNSFSNSSTISDVGVITTSAVGSIVGEQSIGSIGVLTTSYFSSAINVSVPSEYSVSRREVYPLSPLQNSSTIGDIRRLGIIGFDSIKNVSAIGEYLASYNEFVETTSIVGQSYLGNIQVFVSPIVVDTFTPVTRPVKTIPTQSTGFKKFVFRDIALRGGSHPLTGDLLFVTDSAAVAQSIKNIVLTMKTERFFDHIDFGVGIESYLFDLYDFDLENKIKESIVAQVHEYEPRALILSVKLNAIPAENKLGIAISFKIKTTDIIDVVAITLERR